MNKRRVNVTLSLWTDAEVDTLKQVPRWHAFLRGENPSWSELGREPTMRLDSLQVVVGDPIVIKKAFDESDLRAVELGAGPVVAMEPTKPIEAPKKKKTHDCCGKFKNRPHAADCAYKKVKL